jgi:hypothetical protein
MIIGGFYFRLTENENLLGEYFNDNSTTRSTESAVKQPNTGTGYEGVYDSSWVDVEAVTAILTIGVKRGTNGIFSLEWVVDNNRMFMGEGIIVNGILIGNYIDVVVSNTTGLTRP